MPDSVWLPPVTASMPAVPPPMPPSPMMPENVVDPAVTVSTWAPRLTRPEPDNVVIAAPGT